MSGTDLSKVLNDNNMQISTIVTVRPHGFLGCEVKTVLFYLCGVYYVNIYVLSYWFT
jgi:hypothetical protein